MRFASLQSSNVGDYASAGKQVADSAIRTFATQRKYGPDYAGLSKVAMAAQTAEKIAANEASAQFAKASIKAVGNVKESQIKADRDVQFNEQYIASRKAGILPAIGKIVGSAFKKDPKRPPPKLLVEPVKPADVAYPEVDLSGAPKRPAIPEVPGLQQEGSDQSLSSTPAGEAVDKKVVFDYLINDKGLSRNQALGLMANIDRESGFVPAIASGDNGGPGGLFQWNGGRQTETVRRLVESGDWKGQIDYALNEPGEPYSQTYRQTQFDSPQAAADGWMTHWERPADLTAGSRKHSQFISGYPF